ncbi:UTRA domain-containing protein [Prauserella cavernicola]|uniref:UTRA domain-containing protein n=1 Tax=Prauserella cavernicola TaxID=2800127 RepID=A0A934V661_9PSEU|nr:UTRA domain-containing protein [Prauserella cavernicola]
MRANALVVQLDTGEGGAYARLEEAGHLIGSYVENGARMPTPDETSQMELGPGIPVVTVTRVAYRDDGTPLEMNDMIVPSDKYELSYEWPAE